MKKLHNGHETTLEWTGDGYVCATCGDNVSCQPGPHNAVISIPEKGDGELVALITNGEASGEVPRTLSLVQAEKLSRAGVQPSSLAQGYAYLISVATAAGLGIDNFNSREKRLLLLPS